MKKCEIMWSQWRSCDPNEEKCEIMWSQWREVWGHVIPIRGHVIPVWSHVIPMCEVCVMLYTSFCYLSQQAERKGREEENAMSVSPILSPIRGPGSSPYLTKPGPMVIEGVRPMSTGKTTSTPNTAGKFVIGMWDLRRFFLGFCVSLPALPNSSYCKPQ